MFEQPLRTFGPDVFLYIYFAAIASARGSTPKYIMRKRNKGGCRLRLRVSVPEHRLGWSPNTPYGSRVVDEGYWGSEGLATAF